MNKAILTGNLTADPEMMTFDSGKVKCRFTVAVNRKFTDSNGNRVTDFIPVVCWGKTAENCGKYLAKGRKVCVVGAIEVREYNAQDGSKRRVTEVNAEEVEFLSSRQEGVTTSSVGCADSFPGGEAKGEAGLIQVYDDELPF